MKLNIPNPVFRIAVIFSDCSAYERTFSLRDLEYELTLDACPEWMLALNDDQELIHKLFTMSVKDSFLFNANRDGNEPAGVIRIK